MLLDIDGKRIEPHGSVMPCAASRNADVFAKFTHSRYRPEDEISNFVHLQPPDFVCCPREAQS